MTKVIYLLENGTKVDTYREAEASGVPFKALYEEIETETTPPAKGSAPYKIWQKLRLA